MFITIPAGRRTKHLKHLLLMLFGLSIVILFTDPVGFIARLLAIASPGEEGSAYIRVLEYPNIFQNIIHNPIFGVPVGIQWHQYYRMPLFANFTGLGCHNTYLYWPLRTGIFGTVGFLWFLSNPVIAVKTEPLKPSDQLPTFSERTKLLLKEQGSN